MNDTTNLDKGCTFHTKFDGSWWEFDARGIALARVCVNCRSKKLAKYRPEILRDSNYQADESIDGD